jgi:hypothetical protein
MSKSGSINKAGSIHSNWIQRQFAKKNANDSAQIRANDAQNGKCQAPKFDPNDRGDRNCHRAIRRERGEQNVSVDEEADTSGFSAAPYASDDSGSTNTW